MNFALPFATRTDAPPPPVHLPVLAPAVEPSAVRAPGDRFRCEPYRCVLTAAACQARRVAAGEQTRERAAPYRGGAFSAPISSKSAPRRPGTRSWHSGNYEKCRGCSVGAAIDAQLGGAS